MARVKQQQGFLSTVREIIVLLLIVFLIRTFGFGLYQVPTGSMETTMLIGERFFADKFTYLFTRPKRGDIIAFNDPLFDYSKNPFKRLFQEYVWGPSNWTKRVIGIPGDVVKGVVEEGKPIVYLNDKKLDEPHVNKYPLIALWKDNPATLRRNMEQQALQLVQSGQLSREQVNAFMNRALEQYIMCRSYDPTYSYENQPFYRMNPALVLRGENGKPILKEPGKPLGGTGPCSPPEPEIKAQLQRNYWNGTDNFYVHLGPNQYWLMGDNRLGSNDSRFLGPINGRLIHGRILFRIWSIDSYESWWIIDLIKHPIDFWKRIRWSRFFQLMR